MNRRKFLKLAAVTVGLSFPALSGAWWLSNRGEDPPSVDPYAPEPWQDAVSSGPVLVIINENPVHPFGRFLAEILWAEGLNAFTAVRLADISPNLLAGYTCVIVSAGALSLVEVEILANFTSAGGNLIVFQPGDNFCAGLGLDVAAGTISNGSVVTNSAHPLAAGIIDSPLSVHVEAGLYPSDGVEVVARLDDPKAHPAVFLKRLGHGLVIAWAYDLAMNIVLTRQGDPAMATGADDSPMQRPADLITGWMDFERMQYPQADEQQRLLANIVTWLCSDTLPLPRLWYFSGAACSLVVATSDSHSNTFSALTQITKLVEQYSGKLTIFYTPPISGDLGLVKVQAENLGAKLGFLQTPYFPTPEQIADLRAGGHEFTLHPFIDETYIGSWRKYWNAFTRLSFGPVSPTVRTHELEWRGWADAARFQAGFGIRMNTDYYPYGPSFNIGPMNWFYGHFTGSGLPMRFADQDGRILNIYQQVTQFGDEHFYPLPWSTDEVIGPAKGAELTSNFIQSCWDGHYAAITINFHSDPYDLEDNWRQPAVDLLNGSLNNAFKLGVPIWTVQRWLDFTTTRQKSRFETIRWQNKKLACDLVSDNISKDGLSILIPQMNSQSELQLVMVDGNPAPIEAWRVGGVRYGLVKLQPGSHHIEAEYA